MSMICSSDEAVAVDLGGEEPADEVVARWLPPPLLQHVLEVGVHRCPGAGRVGVALLLRGALGSDGGVLEGDEAR